MSGARWYRTGWRTLAGVLLLALATGAVWALASYVGLMRLRVQVTDASDRVEASGRSRAQLAANVIHASSAFRCLEPDLVERLQTAVDRADETTLAATVLDEPERYREFLSAQSELGAALQSVWSRLQANHGVGSQALVNDLRDHLADVEVSLVGHIAELERSVDAYRERSGSFPGSVLATMTRRAESPGPRGGAGGGAGENLAASAAGPG